MPSIDKFRRSLLEYDLDAEIIDKINSGYEDFTDKLSKNTGVIILPMPWMYLMPMCRATR